MIVEDIRVLEETVRQVPFFCIVPQDYPDLVFVVYWAVKCRLHERKQVTCACGSKLFNEVRRAWTTYIVRWEDKDYIAYLDVRAGFCDKCKHKVAVAVVRIPQLDLKYASAQIYPTVDELKRLTGYEPIELLSFPLPLLYAKLGAALTLWLAELRKTNKLVPVKPWTPPRV